MNSWTCRRLLTAAAVIVATAAPAFAVSADVEEACAADYFAHCSHHNPYGSKVRACMQAVGAGLSDRCKKALINAGEVPKTRIERASAR